MTEVEARIEAASGSPGKTRRQIVGSTNQDEDDGMNEQQTPAMTEQEVARRLGLSVATLRAWRLRRRGPRYVRFGRAVRYLAPDLERFVQSCTVDDAAGHTTSPVAIDREEIK